ncbi:MAG: hypothetical protein HY719_03655 [Planctomycetes bacterium]|nr:hypothetical protein [Planctomycetota bacterium]
MIASAQTSATPSRRRRRWVLTSLLFCAAAGMGGECQKRSNHTVSSPPPGGYEWDARAMERDAGLLMLEVPPVSSPSLRNSRPWEQRRMESRVVPAVGNVQMIQVELRHERFLGGGAGFEWDGVVNFRPQTGEVLGSPEIIEPRYQFVYAPSHGSLEALRPAPKDAELAAIDNQPYVFDNADHAGRDSFALLRFSQRVERLFFAFSQRDGLPPPSVKATTPAQGAGVDWWRATGERLEVIFDFDLDMAAEVPFPDFVVKHTLAVPVQTKLSGKRLTLGFLGPISAGPHQVTLNPAGYAPLLRSTSGRVLAPFSLTFEVR